MKNNLCDICGNTVMSVSELHRLKKTTPASWNGSIYLETCNDCSTLLDEHRSLIVQALRETYAKKKRTLKRRKASVVRRKRNSDSIQAKAR